ncbi:MAG TPA: hypothetical protein VGI05_05260 [Streptosporangiaceae bacterium]
MRYFTGRLAAGPAYARLADQVPTPVLQWTTCQKTDQCATAELPLNYQDPRGATIKVALLQVPALDPRHRLGTIFVNPGGPGDSARAWAALLPQGLPKVILDRFDIVGVDPHGVGGSTPIRCFTTKAAEFRTLAPFTATPFPGTPAQQRSWIGAAQALGQACSTTARSIASAMSTTDDALDMDVLRPPGRLTVVPSTSERSMPGSPSSAHGTPGPRRIRTCTGAHSTTAPPRPSW